jgi:hypothetical protein
VVTGFAENAVVVVVFLVVVDDGVPVYHNTKGK